MRYTISGLHVFGAGLLCAASASAQVTTTTQGTGASQPANAGTGTAAPTTTTAPRAPGATASTTLPTVTVTGTPAFSELPPVYAGGQVARGGSLGLLGNRDYMDTPFVVTSITSQAIQDQQARSVSDVVRNDPSVRVIWPGVSYGSQFAIRGFPVQGQDIAVNGVYGIVPPQLTGGLDMMERVEILRGPSALLNGMAPSGAVGGTVNLVTKRATDAPINRVTTNYWSDSQFGTSVDIGRRFGDENQFGIRLNGSYRDGDTSVDDQRQRVGFGSVGLDYRSSTVRLSADLGYQRLHVDNPTRPIYTDNPNFKIPGAPKGSDSLGQPWYYAKSEDTFGMVHGEVDLTPRLTAYATAGGRKNDFLGLYNFLYLRNNAGDFRGNQYYQPTYSDTSTVLGGLTGKLDTGPVKHTLNLSASTLETEAGVLAPVISTFTGNLYDPPSLDKPSLSGRASDAPKTSKTKLSSFAFADTMSALDERVQLTAGVRRQVVEVDNFSAVTGNPTTSYSQAAYTPAFALVVKPWQSVSLYANYIQALSQGPTATAPALNAGTVFAPVKSEQYEIGTKLDLGNMGGSLSYFEIKQPNGVIDPASNLFGIDGEQRNRGVELNAFGEVVRGVRVLGGVTFLDGKLTKTAGGATNGNKAVGVPDTQLNLGMEYDLPWVTGLTLTGRYIYTSSQYYNVTNTQKIPSWNTFDIGARYTTKIQGKQVIFRAAVENLFNKDYWAAASTNYGLARGVPRTYMLSASIDF